MRYMKTVIPHVRLTLGADELMATRRVLRSGYLSAGPEVARLEKQMAKLAGQKAGVAVSSGTAALHTALISLGIKSGDEVIIPTYVCQALLNAVRYVDATPRLVDVDSTTFNIDLRSLSESVGKRTKAIIIPHMFGLMADMFEIKKIVDHIPIIEDCAMGLGAAADGRSAGSLGTISTFSFYATKMITAGEGGMIATNDVNFASRARDFREYDKKKDGLVRYNYKMSDLNAAVALAQLRKLSTFVKKRQAIAKRYAEALAGTNLVLPHTPEGYTHVFARYIVRAKDGDKLRSYLKSHGVQAGKGVVFGLHEVVVGGGKFPVADLLLQTAVSLPIYPALTGSEQEKIINLLLRYKNS